MCAKRPNSMNLLNAVYIKWCLAATFLSNNKKIDTISPKLTANAPENGWFLETISFPFWGKRETLFSGWLCLLVCFTGRDTLRISDIHIQAIEDGW